jgi:ubiquitin carboxyl-terminal hydrolase L5
LQERWIDDVQPFIQQRIERYSANEIRFNLLALIRDRRVVYREEIAQLEGQSSAAEEAAQPGALPRDLQLQE